MKKYVFLMVILSLFLNSCKKALKDFDNYFPSFYITAQELPDGSVQVTATITKEGALAIESAGFAYGETTDFSIDQNQVMVNEISNNTFTCTFPPGFDISKTYYFKAWITNQLGYKASETVSLSNIEAVPVDGPCSNPMNYMYVYQVTETAGNPTSWQQDVDFNQYFNVNGSYSSLKFIFDQLPNTGIYTTTFSAPEPGQVKVEIINSFSGFIQSSLNPGQSVYVNRTSPTTWTFEVCSATYQYNSATLSMSTYFDK